MLEKRQLMKFLQQVADSHHAENSNDRTKQKTDDITTRNERESLAHGRALKRPQNKHVSLHVNGNHASNWSTYVQKNLFPRSKPLQQIMEHAVTTYAKHMSVEEGMMCVHQYVASTGRFDTLSGDRHTSPYLYARYGTCELSQSFCRFAAVHGALYVLRAPLRCWKSSSNMIQGIETHDTRVLRGRHFIASVRQEQDACHVHRVCLIQHPLKKQQQHQGIRSPRNVLVVPPTDSHTFVTYALLLDATTGTCPESYSIVHLWTRMKQREDETHATQALSNALAMTLIKDNDDDVHTVVYDVTWRDISSSPATSFASNTFSDVTRASNFHSTWIPHEFAIDRAVGRAREIFQELCPECEFMAKSESSQQADREENEEEHEEQRILEDAMKQLEKIKDHEN